MIRLLAFLAVATFSLAADKPNVLFLFADYQRADAIGAFNPAVKTPNIDQIVERGFTFRNAYCLGANIGAVCTPSRNMLLSGRAYFRWAGTPEAMKATKNFAPADGPNFAVAFKNAGYQTYHHGKRGNTAQKIQATFETNKYLDNDEAERRSGEPGKVIAEDAIAFLRERTTAKESRPFFMYLAFANPHDPKVANAPYMAQYDRAKIPLPKNFRPQHPWNIGSNTVRDEMLAPWPRTPDEIRKHLHEYYAVMTCLDGYVGKILATLRELGLEKSTVIVWSADHGLTLGSHGMMGKQSVYDAAYKAPLIFAGPGIPHGRSDALCYLLDILPTAIDLAGAAGPKEIDGVSLRPVIEGKVKSVRDSLFLSYLDTQRAIRDERWKLILFPKIAKRELFDLANDPDEMKNLAEEPAQAERIAALTAKLRDWQQRLGDTAPLTVAKPEPAEFVPLSQ
jgi:arylsulfatase A-like enzyme